MKIFKLVICILLSGIVLGLGSALLLAYWQNAEREQNDAVQDDIVFEPGGYDIVGVRSGTTGVAFIVDGVEYTLRSRLLHETRLPDADGRSITARGLPETRAQTAYLAPFVQNMGELEFVVFGNVTRDRGFTIYQPSGREWNSVFSAPNTTNLLEAISDLRRGEYLLIIYFIYGNAEVGSSGNEYSIRFIL